MRTRNPDSAFPTEFFEIDGDFTGCLLVPATGQRVAFVVLIDCFKVVNTEELLTLVVEVEVVLFGHFVAEMALVVIFSLEQIGLPLDLLSLVLFHSTFISQSIFCLKRTYAYRSDRLGLLP